MESSKLLPPDFVSFVSDRAKTALHVVDELLESDLSLPFLLRPTKDGLIRTAHRMACVTDMRRGNRWCTCGRTYIMRKPEGIFPNGPKKVDDIENL